MIVLTDIIDNTRLFNEYPLKMQYYVEQHYKMVLSILRRHGGHVVANEGDSFHLAFQHIGSAVNFCKEFISRHCNEITLFQVRIGMNKGKLCVRKCGGYKVFGESIEEMLNFFRHNDGSRICIKSRLFEKYGIFPRELFCIH